MPMNATPATTPPTMGPVFELREDDAGDGDAEGETGVGVVLAGKSVAVGFWVGVPAGVWVGEELEPPIN